MKFWQTLTNVPKNLDIPVGEFFVLCLFFISLSFGQLSRIEQAWGTFYTHDVILLVWLVLKRKLILSRTKSSLLAASPETRKLLYAFAGWVGVGMIVAYLLTGNYIPFLYLARLIAYSFFIISLFSRSHQFRLIVKILLLSSGMYMVIFGLLQYLLIPDTRFLYLFGWDDHYYRLIGPLLDPNLSGVLYIAVTWMLVAFRNHLPKLLWLWLLIFTGTAIILTYSRASYLSLAASLIFYLSVTQFHVKHVKSWLVPGISLVLAATVYYLAPKPGGEGINLMRTASIHARLETTTSYLNSLEPYQWVIGKGLYTPSPATSTESHAQMPDNIVVTLLVQTGFVGSVIFFMLFTKAIILRNQVEPAVQAALAALIVHSQFNNSLLEPFIFLTFGVALITHLGVKAVKGRTQQ